MLAAHRHFFIGDTAFKTPMLVPSFSSKGFGNVAELAKSFSEALADTTVLISAFDMAHHKMKLQPVAGQLVLIDSGGYEKGGVFDLSDPYNRHFETSVRKWSLKDYTKTISSKWDVEKQPTVLVSYDNSRSNSRYNFAGQIERAKITALAFPKAAIDFLIKPTPDLEGKVKGYFDKDKLAAALSHNKASLNDFDILGVTEKEIGRSIAERVQTIKAIRGEISSNTPIHIFGSLDPITSPIYFCAGADIFDGLTWLRYGYINGLACYQQNALVKQNIILETTPKAFYRMRVQNLRELRKTERQMKQFLSAHNDAYSVFEPNSKEIRLAIEQSDSKNGS